MQRIGVFVCHCGTNIAGTVDVKAVAEALKTEPGVVFSTDYQYMCSQAGQEMIINAVKDNNLTGIVVCSCSPRMHEATFRKTAAKAGINPYMVEIANIREQCSWVHKDVPTGTAKAIILAKTPEAYVRLAQNGVTLTRVNLGGMGIKPGRKTIYKNISASEAEISQLKQLIDQGIPVEIQMVAEDPAIDFKRFI